MVFLTRLSAELQGPVDRVPEVCIEVLSTNRVYDRVAKRALYAEAGVREYWLVDPAGVVERRSGPGLAVTDEVHDVLRSPVLPGFVLDVGELLAR
jgi:Uma2 family endonuclease